MRLTAVAVKRILTPFLFLAELCSPFVCFNFNCCDKNNKLSRKSVGFDKIMNKFAA